MKTRYSKYKGIYETKLIGEHSLPFVEMHSSHYKSKLEPYVLIFYWDLHSVVLEVMNFYKTNTLVPHPLKQAGFQSLAYLHKI